MGRYGVTVNAIAPVARTRMTEGAFDTSAMALPEDNSPIVAWLASEEAGDVTGRVIEIDGGTDHRRDRLARTDPRRDLGRRWEAAEVGPALRELLAAGARRRSRSTAPEARPESFIGWPMKLIAWTTKLRRPGVSFVVQRSAGTAACATSRRAAPARRSRPAVRRGRAQTRRQHAQAGQLLEQHLARRARP